MNNFSRKLAVLLVTSETHTKDNITTIGQATPSFADPEFVDYVELLSASNICFDVVKPEDILLDTFVNANTIMYAVVIFTVPLSFLSDSGLSILKEASNKWGVSIIASYTHVDERNKSFFGIRDLQGKRFLWPLKVKIISWPRDLFKSGPVVSYGLSAGLSGVRKRGLGKLLPKQTFVKILNLLKSQLLPYIKVILDPETCLLATNMKGKPLAWSYRFGNATNYYIALHGDLFLDKFNQMHRLVRSAIEANSGYGMVSGEMEETMVLRLDDPGACNNDYLDTGGILKEEDWKELGIFLEDKKIPLSVMYTPGWVDDGDKKSGSLFIDDVEIFERRAGKLYDSARVKYTPSNSKNGSYDHLSEFRGLKKLVEKGLVDIHSHGLTHLDTDHKRWSQAADKNNDTQWYHEFFHVKNGEKVDEELQLHAMKTSKEIIKNSFKMMPCTFTPSGHRHDADCDKLAYDAGYLLFSADYTGILKNNVLIRNWKIPSVFLYLKDPTPFASKSGYPFVGVVHDYELKQGLGKLNDIIEKWRLSGIKRFISMRELTASLCISIETYYIEAESQIKIVINLPVRSDANSSLPELSGVEIRLRIFLPDKMLVLKDMLSIIGADLLSVREFCNNEALLICLRLKEESSLAINFPLQPLSQKKRITQNILD